MRVCIVGGGKVGYYLSKTLMEHGHDPIIIEIDEHTCSRLADQLELPVIHGDGTLVEILDLARAGGCGALVGVTGRDETNLVACQLAKKVFGIKKTVARVNNPKNSEVLKMLGVDITVSSTDSTQAANTPKSSRANSPSICGFFNVVGLMFPFPEP